MMTFAKDLVHAIALTLFYLGVANGFFAEFAGTCTQGGAGRLFGIVLSIILYIPAFGLLAVPRSNRDIATSMALGLLGIASQIWFALRLAAGVFIWKLSACAVIQDDPRWEFDGNEVLFTTLWILMSVEAIAGTWLVLIRSTKRDRP